MTTAFGIITSALRELGAVAPGEDIDAADVAQGLETLNDILSGWSNEDLMVFANATQSFSTVNGQSAYSIGPTGVAVAGVRPLQLEQAWITESDGHQTPLQLVERDVWNLRNHSITGEPYELRYEPLVPNGSVLLYPTPDAVYAVTIMAHQQFTAFATLLTTVVLPNGYEPALKKALAVQLAPFFGKTPQPVTIALAVEYKGLLKVKNIGMDEMILDPLLMGCHSRSILTDA